MAAMQYYETTLLNFLKDAAEVPNRGLRSSDVVIAGHVKSGTTWLQQIVHQIRTGGDESFQDIYNVIKDWPEIDTSANESEVDKFFPRAYKAHALYETLTEGDEQQPRFIVSFRNPYDSEYSLMKFMWRYVGFDQDVTTDEYKKVAKNWTIPDFAPFIANWYRHHHDSNVLLILYEDLKQNLPECVQIISEFILGEPLKEPVLSKVLHFCSFEYMSKNRLKFEAPSFKQQLGNNKSSFCTMVRPDGGKVGQGKAHLDEAMKRYIDKRWEDIVGKEYGFKNYQALYNECTYFPLQ